MAFSGRRATGAMAWSHAMEQASRIMSSAQRPAPRACESCWTLGCAERLLTSQLVRLVPAACAGLQDCPGGCRRQEGQVGRGRAGVRGAFQRDRLPEPKQTQVLDPMPWSSKMNSRAGKVHTPVGPVQVHGVVQVHIVNCTCVVGIPGQAQQSQRQRIRACPEVARDKEVEQVCGGFRTVPSPDSR
jgi:hypothetical protein